MDSWQPHDGSSRRDSAQIVRPTSTSGRDRKRWSLGREVLDGGVTVETESLLSSKDNSGAIRSSISGGRRTKIQTDDDRSNKTYCSTDDATLECAEQDVFEPCLNDEAVENEVRRSIFRNKSLPKVAEDFGISQQELIHTSKGRVLQAVLFGLAITCSAVGKLVYEWFLTDPLTGLKQPPEGFDPLTLYNASFFLGACIAATAVVIHKGPKRLFAFDRSVWLAALWLGLPLVVSECMDMYILVRLSPLLALILGQTKIPLSVILRAVMLHKRPSFMETLILLCLSISIAGYTLNARYMAIAATTTAPAASSVSTSSLQIQGVILASLNVLISLGGCVMFEGYAGKSPLPSHELFFVIRLAVACMMYMILLVYKSFVASDGLLTSTINFFHGWNYKTLILMAVCSAKDIIGCLVVCRLNVVWKVLSTTVSVMLLYVVECCQRLQANPVQAALLVVALLHVFALIFCTQAAKAAAAQSSRVK